MFLLENVIAYVRRRTSQWCSEKTFRVFNPKTEQWVKRDKDTGRFIDVKQDGTPFKGVTKEKDFLTRAM